MVASFLIGVSNKACDTLHACTGVPPSRISKNTRTVNPFTQQGIEKLNDQYTHYFFNSTNHHDTQALQQLLLKQNHLEYLTDNSYARAKEIQTCSMCKQPGHNKRTCSNATARPPTSSVA